ncbi:protein kintoun isoform X2 [Uranotaenia lowii]|uniref:protein kintoun isoform X2 n=1 Tax=Uranotaenia lowii TaxID=190385 RepID=UPI002479D044|nr:protein kintoun isoform X2 [Uranotaenia lowii]
MSNESFKLSRDEYRNLTRCLGNEEFRALFKEYCEELADPENRKQYEEEIKILEAERGYDVKFVKPLPGYVIKSVTSGLKKVFINVCHCDLINRPTSQPGNDENGQKGLAWSIPYALSEPRNDLDNRKQSCTVYDVVFNYDALYLAKNNSNFRKLVTDTAMDAVENAFKIELDKKVLKFPKIQYKGTPRMTVIRNKKHDSDYTVDTNDKILAPNAQQTAESLVDELQSQKQEEDFITPTFKLVQRKYIELHETTEELDARIDITIPKALAIDIDLPLLDSIVDCDLDVTDRNLQLINLKEGSKYKLNIKLPYEVSEKEGSAKFNADTKILSIVLPVIQKRKISLKEINCMDRIQEDAMKKAIQNDPDLNTNDVTLALKPTPAVNMNTPSVTSQDSDISRKKIFPKYSVNKMESILAFTLNVRNVDPDSIVIKKDTDGVLCYFSNMGGGFYLSCYSFYVRFPNVNVLDVIHEQWDNNIILQLILDNSDVDVYYSGLNENNVNQHSILEDISVKNNFIDRDFKEDSLSIAVCSKQIKARPKSSDLSIEIKTKDEIIYKCEIGAPTVGKDSLEDSINFEDSLDVAEKQNTTLKEDTHETKKSKRNARKRNKKRSVSESLCDQLKKTNNGISKPEDSSLKEDLADVTNQMQSSLSTTTAAPRKTRSISESCARDVSTDSVENLSALIDFNRKYYKGILKHSSLNRSISECSSFEDNSYIATSVDCSGESHNAVELSESCRKTVRFNDFIKTKLFRSNSSILAQKKKNAKKNESKKRVMTRRASEGESTDNEDKDFVNVNDVVSNTNIENGQHDSGISLDSDAGYSEKDEFIVQGEQLTDVVNSKAANQTKVTNKAKLPQKGAAKFSASSDIEFKSDMIFDIEM